MFGLAPAMDEVYGSIVADSRGFIACGCLIDITPITLNLSEKCE